MPAAALKWCQIGIVENLLSVSEIFSSLYYLEIHFYKTKR